MILNMLTMSKENTRTYEVTYPSGQTVQWKNYTITDCLIKFNGHNSMYDYQLKIKEVNE